MLYPIETEVSRAAGSKASASHAIIGTPHSNSARPSTICAAKAGAARPSPMMAIIRGLATPIATPPRAMTRFLPHLSDSQPATGNRRHRPRPSEALLTAKEFGTGDSINSDMYTEQNNGIAMTTMS